MLERLDKIGRLINAIGITNYPKSQSQETSNPSQGADLTGSGRGVVGAILISKAPNSSILFDVAF